jgi:hypothetical protein
MPIPHPFECACHTYCRDRTIDVIDLLLHHPNCPHVSGIPRSYQREEFLKGLLKSLLESLPPPTHDPEALRNWSEARYVVYGICDRPVTPRVDDLWRDPIPNPEEYDRLYRTKLPGED